MKGTALALLLAVVAVAANQCPSDWTHELLLEHPDCNKFYKCTFGQPVELDCWGDLYFNIETWECDWPANVDCGDRNVPGQEPDPEPETTVAPTTTTRAPTTTTRAPTTTTAAPTTTTAAPTTTTAAPTTTTRAPTTTTRAPTTTTAAPTTTTRAPTTTTAAPTTTTRAPTTTTRAPTTTTRAPTTTTAAPEPAPEPDSEFQANGCPVDHTIHWLLPAEDDCNGFYYCVWGERVRRACPPTLHFNRHIQVCDWPANAGCVSN